jgi:hypothetical protein
MPPWLSWNSAKPVTAERRVREIKNFIVLFVKKEGKRGKGEKREGKLTRGGGRLRQWTTVGGILRNSGVQEVRYLHEIGNQFVRGVGFGSGFSSFSWEFSQRYSAY